MQVTLELEFPVSASVLWPWLTEPSRMRSWSAAPVELLSAAPCGRPDGIGAHRSVRVGIGPLRSTLIEEVMQSSPPHHLVYRVISGGGLRQHQGTIDVDDLDQRCRMRWVVEYRTWLPGLEYPMKWMLERQLADSLQSLRDQLLQAPV